MSEITYSVKDYLKNIPAVKTVVVSGIEFPIIALSEEIKELIGATDSRAEMAKLAAENGLAYGVERLSENEDLKAHIDVIWGKEELASEEEPCIKYQVAEAILELSGMGDVLAINAEDDHEEVSVEQMIADTQAAQA